MALANRYRARANLARGSGAGLVQTGIGTVGHLDHSYEIHFESTYSKEVSRNGIKAP